MPQRRGTEPRLWRQVNKEVISQSHGSLKKGRKRVLFLGEQGGWSFVVNKRVGRFLNLSLLSGSPELRSSSTLSSHSMILNGAKMSFGLF